MKKGPQVIIYSQINRGFGIELENMIEELASKENVEICRTVSDLKLKVSMPLADSAIAVLLIADEEDLKNVLSIKPLLINMRIVLILPDRNHETIQAGHSLYPRYLSFPDNDLKDVKAVLTRMMEVKKTSYNDVRKQGLFL